MDSLKKKTSSTKRALTISEAAEYACVSEATMRNWIKSGLIPYEDLPSHGNGIYKFRLIRRIDLDIFLNKHYQLPQKNHKKKSFDEVILLPIE
ncbi:helix-turn-helix domain-containing protein [Candidatus Latescibacterota bacterium]